MDKILIKNKFNSDFIYNVIPKTFYSLVCNELNKKVNQHIISYINKKYKISKLEIINALSRNLIVSKYADKILIYIDDNYYFKEQDVRLKTIIDLFDNGNLEIRGSGTISKIFKIINYNIYSMYQLYLMRGENYLWE